MHAPLLRPSLRRRAAAVCAVATLSVSLACGGGGGGGGGARPAAVQGTLQITPVSGAGGSYLEQEPNDTVEQSNFVGGVGPTSGYELVGSITDAGLPKVDPFDAFRFRSTASTRLRVTLTAKVAPPVDIDLLVYDVASQQLDTFLSATTNPETGFLDVTGVDTEFDFVVVSSGGASAYTVKIEGGPPPNGPDGPGGAGLAFTGGPSHLLPDYLGARHPMIAGEVVILRDPTEESAPTLDAIGLELVRSSPSGMSVHRVAGMAPAPRVGPLAEAAELETAVAAARARREPGVLAASPNYLYTASNDPDDTHYGLQWHYKQIKLPLAWDLTQGNANTIVAVLDTGVVLAHPDLAPRLIAGYDFISDPARAGDGNGIDANPDDPGDGGAGKPSSFHGTHVAGTVGCATDNQIGVAGVDWTCRVMPVRVLGKGGGALADIAEGIRYAAGLSNASGTVPGTKADVINMSLGGPGGSAVLEQACNAARNAGVVVVAASGNDKSSVPSFPASYASVISVGAVRFDKQLAPYSNFASTVDIVAPGGDVTVDQNGDQKPDGVLSAMCNDQREFFFQFLNGTSMAAPHVAGVAALIKGINPALTPAAVEDILLTTTEDLGAPGKDATFANGLLDAFAAVKKASNTSSSQPVLVVNPTTADFGSDRSETVVTLANAGAGVINVTGVDVQFQKGAAWLTATPEGTSATITRTAIRLAVNRAGLADGEYSAFVDVLVDALPRARITVLVRAGAAALPDDTIYVLLLDPATLDTLAQADTDRLRGFVYRLPDVPLGSYVVVAGTDRDNDDIIAEEEDLFGAWPTLDTLDLLVVAAQQDVQGISFPVSPQTSPFGGRTRGFRRLR